MSHDKALYKSTDTLLYFFTLLGSTSLLRCRSPDSKAITVVARYQVLESCPESIRHATVDARARFTLGPDMFLSSASSAG